MITEVPCFERYENCMARRVLNIDHLRREPILCNKSLDEREYRKESTETHLVRITTNTCDTLQPEIKWCEFIFALIISTRQSRQFKIRDNEASQTTVDMQPDVVFMCQSSES